MARRPRWSCAQSYGISAPLGAGRCRSRAPDAVACGRIWLRNHPLFYRRAGASDLGRDRTCCDRWHRRGARAPSADCLSPDFGDCRCGGRICHGYRQARDDCSSGAPGAGMERRDCRLVEAREERERSDRIVIRVHRLEGTRITEKPDRVRISVRRGMAPPVGAFVELKARLSPPLAPLRPGGYDFARDSYFQRIGASGFVLGRIRTVEPPVPRGLWLRYAAKIDALREAIDSRIRAVLPGDKGAIASALITGKRDAISTPVNEAMYISGIGHVLSISGYHMARGGRRGVLCVARFAGLIPGFRQSLSDQEVVGS